MFRRASSVGTSAHPRSRGENSCRVEGLTGTGGSSPLTRGKLSCTACPARQWRLIPAHAGKTTNCMLFSISVWAHPRSRGENEMPRGRVHTGPGSSPLTRGKRGAEARPPGGRRLIPAHAGKTSRVRRYTPPPLAHPRSRGENIEAFVSVPASEGSSPLTRGKHKPGGQRLTIHRLIPAHAGKTTAC